MKTKFDIKKIKKTTIYMLVSLLVFLGCCGYYGARFVYYYNVSKGKIVKATTNLNELLTNTANIALEGDGLRVDGKTYYFYGQATNNYVYYSGILWRVLSIDEAGNIKLISDKTISTIPWNTSEENNDYGTSLIRYFLSPSDQEGSGYFYSLLNKPEEYLVPTKLCVDKSAAITEPIACDLTIDTDYVGLVNNYEYLKAGGENSFMNTNTHFWSLTSVAGENATEVYYIFNEGGIGSNSEGADEKYAYGVKPVITLKANLDITSGSGLADSPYCIEETKEGANSKLNTLQPGTCFTYSGYNWMIVSTSEDSTKAIMMDVIRNAELTPYLRKFSNTTPKYKTDDTSNLGYYLNNTWIKSLENPEYLTTGVFYNGIANYASSYSLTKLQSSTIKAKVGLPQLYELGTVNNFESNEYFTDQEITYWLGNYKNGAEDLVWVMRFGDWIYGDFATNKNAIRPVIYLNNKLIVTTGNGTLDFPYSIEEASE